MNEKQKKLQDRFYRNWADLDPMLMVLFSANWSLRDDAYSTTRKARAEWEELYDTAIELLADEPVKELKDYTLAEIAELVHDMAKEKGWWDGERPWPEIACLIHSEISEAVECYRNGEMVMHIVDGKPEGLVVELADVLIRCLDFLASHNEPLSQLVLPEYTVADAQRCIYHDESSTHDMLQALHAAHIEVDDYGVSATQRVEQCIRQVLRTAKRFNLDLQSAVVAKIEYNAKRPYRHGGKKA